MPMTTRRVNVCLLLVSTISMAACGAAGSGNVSHGPSIGREGASSGAMSRAGVEDTTAPPISSNAYPTEGSVPQPGGAEASLGGDAVRAGAFSTPMPIAVGQTISGHLDHTDTPLQDGSVADDYVFVAAAGTTIRAELHGGAVAGQPGSHMDMYLYLLRDGAEITHNDDGAGNLDSLIETAIPTTGAYTLRVTTFGSGLREGDYTLSLRAE